MFEKIIEYLGNKSDYLLNFKEPKISKDMLTLPSPDFVDKVFMNSDRNNRVMQKSFTFFLIQERLAGTGYMSLLPVDQGVEHSAGASFAKNPLYLTPKIFVKRWTIEGGCNGVASTFGALGIVSRKYAHKIPFIVKSIIMNY